MAKFSVRDMMAAPADPPAPVDVGQPALRTIDTITAEINYYKQQTAQNIIEIGRRLIEAKQKLPHGQWTNWLRDTVEFSQQTATNFMNIAMQYSNSQPVGNLSYTKLVALLQVPDAEREDFLAKKHVVNGEEKTVDEMSKREFEAVVKERNKAVKQLADEKLRASQAEESLGASRTLAGDRARRIFDLEKQIEELKNAPIEVAVAEISAEEHENIRQEAFEAARHEMKEEYDRIDQELTDKLKRVFELRRENMSLRNQLEDAEKNSVEALPEEVTRDATADFLDAVGSAYRIYKSIIELSAPDCAATGIKACRRRLDELQAELSQLEARAANLAIAGDDELPGEEDDD